ncbi:hypothetical protein KY290_019152 [Solanum tuberosum]|uniref:Uncharacterized protein n=1 Tax=Solanum tuberosum TaxID=4113 RepID=A0ABQ7VG87_SOLTU|nr:hypothetical protein KY290_019152 [Solanum tuberosum]
MKEDKENFSIFSLVSTKFLEWIRSSLETCQSELKKAEKRIIRVQFERHENINDLLDLINEIDFHEINRAWFLQLRSHLTKLNNRIGLALTIRDQTSFSALGKRGHKLWSISIGRIPTQVVPHIGHLKLDIRFKVPEESHGCLLKYIIDNLLWMSHPNVLTLSMPTSFAAFALGICNEFLISRREGNCCADTQNKCWRHFLKDFMVREAVTNEKEELKKFSFVFTWQL